MRSSISAIFNQLSCLWRIEIIHYQNDFIRIRIDNYAKKILDAILLIGPVAIITIIYSHASHLASENKKEELAKLISKTFRVLVYIGMPLSCILIELREPFLRYLFQRGSFDADSTLGTSKALFVYAFGLITFSVENLFVHSFFALSDTKTPIKYGIVCVLIDILLAVLLLKHFEHMGIAAALVLAKTIKVVMLASRLHKRITGLFDLKTFYFVLKSLVATALLWIVLRIFSGEQELLSLGYIFTFRLILPSVLGILAFLGCSYFLKIPELRVLITMLASKK